MLELLLPDVRVDGVFEVFAVEDVVALVSVMLLADVSDKF